MKIQGMFKKKFVIGLSDVDKKGKLKLSELQKRFVECAGEHSALMGLGTEKIRSNGISWVLSKVRIEIFRLPEAFEEIEIETWPHETGNVAFDRDFLVFDKAGNEIAKAASRWCLIDVKTRKPVAKSKISFDVPEYIPKHNFDPMFCAILRPGESAMKQEHRVVESDLDYNNHVTNTRYFDFLTDCVEKNGGECFDVSSVSIDFLSEALLGELLEISCERTDFGYLFLGKICDRYVFVANLCTK